MALKRIMIGILGVLLDAKGWHFLSCWAQQAALLLLFLEQNRQTDSFRMHIGSILISEINVTHNSIFSPFLYREYTVYLLSRFYRS